MNELFTTIFWSGVTLAAFFGWRRIFLALKHPVLHPILWATLAVVLLLALGLHSVAAYREESAPLGWLLGPAVVAMAFPVWQRRQLIAANWQRLLLFEIDSTAGAFATIGMTLTAICAGFVLPCLLRLI